MSYWIATPKGKPLLSTQLFQNGNMIYSTAMYLFLTPKRDLEIVQALREFEVKPGLYSRYADQIQNTSVDDYLAAASLPGQALRILNYGRAHFGFFDCEKGFFPKPKQFLFRFQGFWQHARIVAGEDIKGLGAQIWSTAIRLAASEPETNQDGWIQSHLMVLAWEGSWMKTHPTMFKAVQEWKRRKPKATWKLMADYIGDSLHPLVEAWKNYG
jgi:hypothetical protein